MRILFIIFLLFLCVSCKKDNRQVIEGDLYFKLIDFDRIFDAPDSVLSKMETYVKTVKKDTLSIQNRKMCELLEHLIDNQLIRKPFIRLRLDDGQIRMVFLDTLDYKRIGQFERSKLIKENKKIRIKANVEELYFDTLTAYNTIKLISIDEIEGKTHWRK